MSKLFIILLFTFFSLNAFQKKIDIVSYGSYYIPHEDCPINYQFLEEEFDVRYYVDLYNYVRNFNKLENDLQKIVFIDYCQDPKTQKIPEEKIVCFKWEAIKINPKFYDYYKKVYTFDDDLVDEKKFFKFYYPVLKPMESNLVPFNEKRFCSMVVRNWIPERIKILDFFSNEAEGFLDVYGSKPKQYKTHKMMKGEILGHYSSQQKINTLKNYRFCVCFENTHTTPGYITEKIFDVFAAGCVPIYWGPNNVEKFIPPNCFIDYRKFSCNEEMLMYLFSINEEQYEEFIENIRHFLLSEKAWLFSAEHFALTLYEAIKD